MERIMSSSGGTVSFDVLGSGPPLILVHGVLTDHESNWLAVKSGLAESFTVHAVARRGRGKTTPTQDHSIRDEFADVASVIQSVETPVFLLGHSYGAHVALGAAALSSERVGKLVLYEPPVFHSMSDDQRRSLEEDAARGDWDSFAARFLEEVALTPRAQLDAIRKTPIWEKLVDGARPTLADIHALQAYDFEPQTFATLPMPVLLLSGSESPPIQTEATELLADALPTARRLELAGQGHVGMLTDPAQFIEKVTTFLLA